MLALTLAGCAGDAGEGVISDARDSGGPVRIVVEEAGADGGTRASMTAARGVAFTSGDCIGIYVTDAGGSLLQRNIAAVKTDEGEWSVLGTLLRGDGYCYYAYYPFTGDSGTDPHSVAPAVNATATAFFASLIGSWTPAADQGTQAKLESQDLMVARGEVATVPGTDGAEVSFVMHHQMALVELALDANASTAFVTNTPCHVSGNTYAFIAKPLTAYTFAAGGAAGDGHWTTGEVTSPAGNKYKQYNCQGIGLYVTVGDHPVHQVDSYTLEVMDDADDVTLTATTYPTGGAAVAWTSSNTSAATVSAASANSVTLDILGAGTTTVSATYQGVTVSFTVTVESSASANPLWYVAEYNLAQGKNSFVGSHSTSSQYVFRWSDIPTSTVTIGGHNYHVPSKDEQVSIIPNNGTIGDNIFAKSGTLASPVEYSEVACTVGGNAVPASTSVIGKQGNSDYYAVRFIGTSYASVWHYQWVSSPCNGLLIESYLLPEATDLTAAKSALASLKVAGASGATFTGTYGASGANLRPTDTPAAPYDFVQRFLPACGNAATSVGSGTASANVGADGYYWSSTANPANDSNAFNWGFYSGRLYEYQYAREYGFSVRLFAD